MELRSSQKPLEFKYEDVTFFVKAWATEEDRMFAQMSGEHIGGGKIKFTQSEFCRILVERMVIGWKGVTREGKDVAFSYGELESFPPVKGRNLFVELGSFILDKTDIRKDRSEAKNA